MQYLTYDQLWISGVAVILLISPAAHAEQRAQPGLDPLEACFLESMKTAAPETTIGEIRTQCQQIFPESTAANAPSIPEEGMTPVQIRMLDDQISYNRKFSISAFQPNYFIGTYSTDPNGDPFADFPPGEAGLENEEAKFQVSIKAPLWRTMFGSNNDLIAAYTSTSWWQVTGDSSAFRETNYQPELFLRHYGGWDFLGGQFVAADLGFNHQSNGRGEALSRSWNRVMGRLYLDYDSIAVGLRAWYRIPESEDSDDNPGMHRYYGYGDVLVAYAPNKNTFTAMLRPGTQKGGLELTWSYPLTNTFRAYAQYWNGYGESLIDYDARIERIGIGISLNDWLERR
jgi:phospholipase A1/A2